MILPQTGNILNSSAHVLVNPVNTRGVMGAGLALQFARRFPTMLPSYQSAVRDHAINTSGLHHLFPLQDSISPPHYILNFATKDDWRNPSQLSFIEAGLKTLPIILRALGPRARSVAVPPLGAGLGGLPYSQVRPLIEHYLGNDPDFDLHLFLPHIHRP